MAAYDWARVGGWLLGYAAWAVWVWLLGCGAWAVWVWIRRAR